ncbi:MAG: ATP-binding protein [Halothiobacillus sp.]
MPSHLLSKLYEHTSVLITTNLTFAEWPSVFGQNDFATGVKKPANLSGMRV